MFGSVMDFSCVLGLFSSLKMRPGTYQIDNFDVDGYLESLKLRLLKGWFAQFMHVYFTRLKRILLQQRHDN